MRRAKPWFRKQTGTWYVQLNGTKHNLGPDKREAFKRYDALMAGQADAGSNPIVVELFDCFLQWAEKNQKPNTFNWYKRYVVSFGEFIGKRMRTEKLKAHHITEWLAANGWKGSTAHDAVSAAKRPLKWAVEQQYLKISPLQTVKQAKGKPRELVIEPEQWEQILAAIKNQSLREILIFIRETGCRPQEARAIEARHFDAENDRLILPASESKGETDARVIYLTTVARELIDTLAKRNPTGSLFRNTKGKRWSKDALSLQMRRIRERTGIKGLCAYTLRHTFATESLTRGEDSVTVAALMGHKDATMVAKTYGHLTKKPHFLRQAAKLVKVLQRARRRFDFVRCNICIQISGVDSNSAPLFSYADGWQLFRRDRIVNGASAAVQLSHCIRNCQQWGFIVRGNHTFCSIVEKCLHAQITKSIDTHLENAKGNLGEIHFCAFPSVTRHSRNQIA